MITYRVRIAFHNPSALTFMQLDHILQAQCFWKSRGAGGRFRYFTDYEYVTENRQMCEVCSLAYSAACQVKKCPLVLVEVKQP